MQTREPIRIISDLHLGHPACLLDSPADLAPLLRGVGTVIFNGDTSEMRSLEDREKGWERIRELEEVCRCLGVKPVLINGNHDPIVSPHLSHLDLADGAILVTHGDMLFHDISPWSKEAEMMGEAHTQALEELEEEAFADFEKRLHANKKASIALELLSSQLPRGPLARLSILLRECWPPTRPLRILKVWKNTPDRAEALARVFRPRARFILVGHTHYEGIWQRGPRVVINTGSFTPPMGRLAVDIEGNRLRVNKIVKSGGHFELGKQLAEFEISRLRPHEGF
jgi:predicted phosphodiesterase